ncbi:T9SS type A sorting domain-containing protein [Cryomorpha ignava]|uniref:T9SS type A sorting domain-containing protein n=1 Tax=Cryomorpha ignava TaxID=101383 RepID=A0A7K3WT86_9FLAO|nr:T9SS type A sorting domain-containing protein [Cryomorpha ignava]
MRGIDVFDTYGRNVTSTNSNSSSTIEMSGLPNGVYFVRVKLFDNSFGTTKILKTE